jgi:uncharacterized protein (DUF58 family)
VRKYQPGDDPRTIDWNVSARMNEPFVKLFTEERDRTVNLLIDMSASGLFGSRTQAKREVAAEIAAAVAFSAIQNNDRVGLVIFTDDVELYLPPKKGRRHVLRVIREILTFEPQSRKTNIAAGLDYLGKVTRRKSVAFVISDFLATGWEQPIRIANRRHDVIPVVVTDPMEEQLPKLGLVTFEDVESGQVVEFDSSGPEARAYADYIARLRGLRETALRRLKLDFVNVRTDRSHVDALVEFFRIRARRMQHA